MEIVIDTNILISALIKSSKTRELILSSKLTLHSPEHIINETLNNKKEILQKSGLNDAEFKRLISILLTRINLVPVDDFKNSVKYGFGAFISKSHIFFSPDLPITPRE